jgi:pyruvate,orthophosphate dikinase
MHAARAVRRFRPDHGMGRRDAAHGVRTNAETPADARAARSFGAEGIGLCRTEHMFFDGDRIVAMREMILPDRGPAPQGAGQAAADAARTSSSCSRSWPACRSPSACSIRRCTSSCPRRRGNRRSRRRHRTSRCEKLTQRVDELHEFNPMLGHRGCRLAISYPEIAEMQARAIFEAAVEAAKSTPARRSSRKSWCRSSAFARSFDFVKARIDAVAREVIDGEAGVDIDLSRRHHDRAAARRHPGPCEIAEVAEFFSFGTNDLTQTTFGISRDDASSFLMTYQQKGIIEQDPFVTLDIDGVGELVRRSHPTRAGQPGPTSSSASAASTAATRPRSSSANRSVSTMSAARRSACRSPALPPRRRRSHGVRAVSPDPLTGLDGLYFADTFHGD